MGWPVVTVASGGMPITDVTSTLKTGMPVTEATNKFGAAVTKVTSGGMPVVFVSETGGPPVSPTTWNSADTGGAAVVGGVGNLTLSASAGGNTGARSTNPLSAGKIYFEIAINVNNSSGASSGFAKGGVAPDQITANPVNGGVVVIWSSGGIWAPSNTGITLGAFANGSVLCAAVDIGAKLVWFRKNNGIWNNSGTANPATAIGGISCSTLPTPYYGFSGTANGTESSTANFGATAFAQGAPAGFISWNAGT